MKLKPLNDDILFVFHDEIENGKFVDKYGSIYLGRNEEATIKQSRWGKVVATGPTVVEDIKPGMNVLVEALGWTRGIDYDGFKIWRTNNSKIIGVEDIE